MSRLRMRELLRNGVTDVAYYMCLHGGGGGKGGSSAPQVIQQPAAPQPIASSVAEERVQVDEDDDKNKRRRGKGSLKIPLDTLPTASNTGLNMGDTSGLRV